MKHPSGIRVPCNAPVVLYARQQSTTKEVSNGRVYPSNQSSFEPIIHLIIILTFRLSTQSFCSVLPITSIHPSNHPFLSFPLSIPPIIVQPSHARSDSISTVM